jgi:hypothetical protein
LVSMAVLGLLVAMLAQMLSMTDQAISLNSKKLDAAGQARVVFDRLATDLESRPRRADMGVNFIKARGNDSLNFYGEVNGYSGNRPVTAIGYRIQQSTPGRLYQLERGAVGTDWGPAASSNPFVQFLPNTATAASNSDPNYDVLGNGVFRFEFCYLLNTGVMSNSAQSDLGNVVAVVIAIGILDARSLRIISSSQLGQLSASLPDSTEGMDPISGWNTAVAATGFGAGVPPQAIQGVRLYQRTFYVP